MTNTVDLNTLTKNGQISFLSGKKKGLEARNQLDLEAFDKASETVDVLFNESIDCNESFLGGLFSNSIANRGSRSNFLKAYNIIGMNDAVRSRLNAIITATLSEGTSLSKLRDK